MEIHTLTPLGNSGRHVLEEISRYWDKVKLSTVETCSLRQWLWKVTKTSGVWRTAGRRAHPAHGPLQRGPGALLPPTPCSWHPFPGQAGKPELCVCDPVLSLLCADSGREVQRPRGNEWQRQTQAQACQRPRPTRSQRAGRGSCCSSCHPTRESTEPSLVRTHRFPSITPCCKNDLTVTGRSAT